MTMSEWELKKVRSQASYIHLHTYTLFRRTNKTERKEQNKEMYVLRRRNSREEGTGRILSVFRRQGYPAILARIEVFDLVSEQELDKIRLSSVSQSAKLSFAPIRGVVVLSSDSARESESRRAADLSLQDVSQHHASIERSWHPAIPQFNVYLHLRLV